MKHYFNAPTAVRLASATTRIGHLFIDAQIAIANADKSTSPATHKAQEAIAIECLEEAKAKLARLQEVVSEMLILAKE